jgi:hypothetical protein
MTIPCPSSGKTPEGLLIFGAKLRDYLNRPDDVVVQGVEIFSTAA